MEETRGVRETKESEWSERRPAAHEAIHPRARQAELRIPAAVGGPHARVADQRRGGLGGLERPALHPGAHHLQLPAVEGRRPGLALEVLALDEVLAGDQVFDLAGVVGELADVLGLVAAE